LFITIVVIIWVFVSRKDRIAVSFIHICTFFMISMGLVGLWQIRNELQTGYPGFSSIGDVNLYYYQGASTAASMQGLLLDEMQNKFTDSLKKQFPNPAEQYLLNQNNVLEYMRKQGLKLITAHPVVYAKIHLKGMFLLLFIPEGSTYLKLFKLYPAQGGLIGNIIDQGIIKTLIKVYREKPLAFCYELIFGLILSLYILLAVKALILEGFIRNISIVIILGVAAYFLIISSGPFGYCRFRHPVMPLICILAGYGLYTSRYAS